MNTLKLNTYIYQLSSVVLFIALVYITWSYNKQYAIFLLGLQVMREISKYNVVKELEQKEEKMEKEFLTLIESMRNKNV